MPPTFSEPDDDLLEQELVNYQQQLESGIQPAPERDDRTRPDLPPELHQSLIGLKRCLDLLNETRLESASSDERTASTIADSGYAIPEKIGKFVITELLGIGGFGIVFKGLDQGINRQVAIKIPKPEHLPNLDLIQRFTGEAAAVAQLDHPNIVPVYESSQYGITPYIVMPFVGGKTLADWMSGQGVIPTRMAAELVWQLAEGVAHAHERKILHRDLKPGNVLLEPRDPEANTTGLPFVPRLTDFGLAKSTEASRGGTITGTVIGTVCYMSPEQASGKTDDIQKPADVYSLGAILYELLCGVPPFRGETDVQTVLMLLKDEARSPALLRKDLPRDLEVICLKCLEKSPAQRYSSARDLADDLRRYLDGEPIQAKPNSRIERLVKWCRRNPVKASLTMVLGLSLLTLVSVSLWYNSRLTGLLTISERNRATLVAQSAEIRRSACLSDTRLAQMAWDQGHYEQAIRLLERHLPKPEQVDVRHFAWWHLWDQFQNSSRTIGEHEGGATAVAISFDGRLAASAGKDGVIRVYQLPSGEELYVLRPQDLKPINSLEFSPDGKSLASAGESRSVLIWDLEARKLIYELAGHTESILDVVYSPDGKLLASAGGDLVVRLWDPATGNSHGILSGHTKTITTLAFHPHDPLLASTGKDGTIRLWDLKTLGPDLRIPEGIIRMERPNDWCRPIAISPDGTRLVGGTIIAQLLEWSLRPEDFGRLIGQHNENSNARSLNWTPKAGLLIGHTTNSIRAAQMGDHSQTRFRLERHSREIESLVATPDGQTMLSASGDHTVRLWPLQDKIAFDPSQILVQIPAGERIRCWQSRWSNNGFGVELDTIIPVGLGDSNEDGTLQSLKYCILSAPNGELRQAIDSRRGDGIELSRSGRKALLCNRDGDLRSVDVATGKIIWQTQIPPYSREQPQRPFVLIHDSEHFALICWGQDLLKVELSDGRVSGRHSFSSRVMQGTFGEWKGCEVAILACFEGKVVVWNPFEMQLVEEKLLPTQREMTAIAISKDGSFLATGTTRGAVEIRESSGWELKSEISLADISTQLEFAKDGGLLVTRSRNIQIWDLETHSNLLTFPSENSLRSGKSDKDQIAEKSIGQFSISPDRNSIALPCTNRIIVIDLTRGE